MQLRKAQFDVVGYDACDIVGGEQRCVEAEVVGRGVAPALVGVEVVVACTQTVGALAEFVGFFARVDVAACDNTVDAAFGGSMHEQVDGERVVAKHVVGGASDDDAWACGGEAPDHVGLGLVD